ncbi:MAG: hypothetical protein LBQ70_01345, partial [Prevotellaceae bacterium]|nr:hypothetical protein [Prevotellaceae bacterium]
MVKHYLKIAFRNLRKYGTQNIISMFGLSISVACFALCFYVVRSFTTMDKEFPDSNRMYTLYDSVRTYPAFAH